MQDNYKKKICRELISNILARKPKMCSFIEWKELKIVYKRYASLYFCAAIDVRLMHLSDLKWPTGCWQRADCSWDHSSLRRAAGQVLWECKFFSLDLSATEKMFLGVWAGYHLQLWESLLHAWWAPDRRWSPRDIKEECSQSNRCSGPAPRGWSRPNLWSSFTIPLFLRRRHRKDFLMMQAWANIRFSTRTVGKLGDSVPTISNHF